MHEHHCRGCVYAGTGHSYDRKGRIVPRNAVRTRERSPFRGRTAAMQAQRSYASALALALPRAPARSVPPIGNPAPLRDTGPGARESRGKSAFSFQTCYVPCQARTDFPDRTGPFARAARGGERAGATDGRADNRLSSRTVAHARVGCRPKCGLRYLRPRNAPGPVPVYPR